MTDELKAVAEAVEKGKAKLVPGLVQAALDGVREISLFTRDPKREHTLKIVSALRERTGCKIQLFSYEDEDVLRRELADSQILTNGTNLGMAPHEEGCILPDASPSKPQARQIPAHGFPRQISELHHPAPLDVPTPTCAPPRQSGSCS